jgi:hypothetical protein
MMQHEFLLTPSTWIGQGKIQLNMIAEELVFFTRWDVGIADPSGRIESTQEIQVKGLSDIMHNQFAMYDFTSGTFLIDLENQALGRIVGKGVMSEKVIAWEFRVEEMAFDGFEFYEKIDDKNYLMRAEYATSDQFRTVIEGKVWQQLPSTST